jgi:hypothetical protein
LLSECPQKSEIHHKQQKNKNMTALKPTPAGALETETPFSLAADCPPRDYLKHLPIWPGLPVAEIRPLVSAEQRKQIAKIFAGLEATEKQLNENDIITARQKSQQLFQSGTPAAILEGETLVRAAATMSLEKFTEAQSLSSNLRADARQLAASLALEFSEKLLPLVVEEIAAQESRLVRFGRPLFEERNIEGHLVREWTLHNDPIICQLWESVWNLRNHWPTEFLEERFSYGAGLDWLQKISQGD